MNPEAKRPVQAAMFDLLVAMEPSVGDVVDIAGGLIFMTLHQHHQGDLRAVAEGMRGVMEQMIGQIPIIERVPMAVVPGTRLDS